MEGQLVIDGSWAQWANALAAIVALVIALASNIRSARKSELALVHERISTLKNTVVEQGERLARAEAVLDHLPTRDMVAELATKLEQVSGDVRVGNAHYDGLWRRIDGIGTAVDQLVENEMRGQRK